MGHIIGSKNSIIPLIDRLNTYTQTTVCNRFLAAAVLLLVCVVFSTQAAVASEPVILTNDKAEYLLGKYLEILEDTEKRFKVEEVISSEFAGKFVHSRVDVPNFGLGDTVHWLRFHINNETSEESRWFLEISWASLRYIDAYTVSPDGEAEFIGRTGGMVPGGEKLFRSRYPVIPITITPGSRQTVYLRIESIGAIIYPLTLYTPEAFSMKQSVSDLAVGLFGGIMLALFLYNSVIFLMLGHRAFLYYVLVIAVSSFYYMVVFGIPQFYLWPASHWWVTVAWAFFLSLIGLLGGLMNRYALSTARYAPVVDRLLKVFIAVSCVFAIAVNILPIPIVGGMLMVFVMSFCAFILSINFLSWHRGFKTAGYFLVAWIVFFVGLPLSAATMLGLLPYNTVTSNLDVIGILVAVVLGSSALAGHVRSAEGKRDQARALATTTQRLTRYFPKTLVEKILSSEEEVLPISQRKLVTVFFSDLRGFTDLTDRVAPERIGEILNEYITGMMELINRHGGTLDKIMGDGIMAFFGAPDEMDKREQARAAVTMAVEMQKRLGELGEKWNSEGIDHNMRLRVGITQDYVTVGNFGSNELMSYTAIGEGVNLASRMEAECPPGRILVSFSVYSLTKNEFPYGEIYEKDFKGFARRQKVAELNPSVIIGLGD
jgi:class 3 adenylate cyclase